MLIYKNKYFPRDFSKNFYRFLVEMLFTTSKFLSPFHQNKFSTRKSKTFFEISWKKYQNYSATNNSLSFCIDKIFAFNKVVKQLIPEPLNLQ